MNRSTLLSIAAPAAAGARPHPPSAAARRPVTPAEMGLIVVAGLGSLAALWHTPSPSLPVLLFTLLAIWAELVVLPPWYAGWPSQLLPLLTLIAVNLGPAFVLPALLVALAMRIIRRRLTSRDVWPGPLLALDAAIWIVACLCGASVTQGMALLLHHTPLASALFRPDLGEVGMLLLALAWTASTSGAALATGALCAHLAGYGWRELTLGPRLGRSALRAGRVAVLIYLVVAICDALLVANGPLIVTVSLLLAMTWLAARARRLRRHYTALAALAQQVEAKDAYTGDHLATVARRTGAVAAALGLPAARIDDYARGALLHDVGKLAVSTRILTKPGKLDADELNEMRAHTTVGRVMLGAIPGLGTAADIAGHHHECWDGSGYPEGLARASIPLAARIVTVVDAVDAMTTDRPYHRAIALEDALAEVDRHSGAPFDPTIAAALRRVVQGPSRPALWRYFTITD